MCGKENGGKELHHMHFTSADEGQKFDSTTKSHMILPHVIINVI